MADDTLTPEQVAEIRETEINRRDWDSPASPIPALCDTVDALREQLREARKDGAKMRHRRDEYSQDAQEAWKLTDKQDAEIRRLTDALRDRQKRVTPNLLKRLQQVAHTTEFGWQEDTVDEAASILRALAEMEDS